MQFIDRMKQRWGVTPWGVIAIIIAFSLAGMTVVRVKRPILHLLLPSDAPRWEWWGLYVLLIVPLYYTSLLLYGSILGQRDFFWRRLKRTGRWVAGRFIPRPRSDG
jgi:hypothetical protein